VIIISDAKANITSNKISVPCTPASMQQEHNIASVVFLPKINNLNLS
jgi:hypothetical protein